MGEVGSIKEIKSTEFRQGDLDVGERIILK
jgi:hypothetical protein